MSLLVPQMLEGNFSYDLQVEDLLQRLCSILQLNTSHYEKAEKYYKAVAEWLKEDPLFKDFDLEIYPQGSVRIGTTVKPSAKEEFDVDLVLEIQDRSNQFSDPMDLLDEIERIMKEYKLESGEVKIERKNRCIQLQYPDQFHMDILPAIPVHRPLPDCVKVPDCSTEDWKPSNPKGYAEWFEEKASDFEPLIQWETYMEKSAKVADLPDPEPVDIKPPLKRAVQLMKHIRNRYFTNLDVKAPVSIVLTTLAAEHYNKQGSVYLAIEGILNGIIARIESEPMIEVKNPKNPGEILSERWQKDDNEYKAFVKFIRDFRNAWIVLPQQEGKGLTKLSESLGQVIDPDVIQKGFQKQAIHLQALREDGKLRMKSATQVAAALAPTVSVPRNTFYGSE